MVWWNMLNMEQVPQGLLYGRDNRKSQRMASHPLCDKLDNIYDIIAMLMGAHNRSYKEKIWPHLKCNKDLT
jgi:hypothetical protein